MSDYPDRLGDAEAAIIEAIREQDGVGGLTAFHTYRAIVERHAIEEAAARVAEVFAIRSVGPVRFDDLMIPRNAALRAVQHTEEEE